MAAPGSPPLKAPLVDAALYTHTAAPAMVPLPQRPALRTAWQSLELAAAALAEAQYPHRFEGRSPTSLVQAQQEYLTAMRDYQELRAKIYSQGADVKSDRGDYQVLDVSSLRLAFARAECISSSHSSRCVLFLVFVVDWR